MAVILMGAYLSALNQGLSCPEWPLCPTGLGFPPTDEYVMEYIHRFTAIVTAVAVYITTIYSLIRFISARKPAIISSIAVSLQIAIGMLVVLFKLEPVVVAIHTGVGVITLAMALLTFILTFPAISGRIASSSDGRRLSQEDLD